MRFFFFLLTVCGTFLFAAEDCDIGLQTETSASPQFLTENNQTVTLQVSLNCPANTQFRLYTGYTIEWGDGTENAFLHDKTIADYNACLESGKSSCGTNPFSSSYRDNLSGYSSFTQTHRYAELKSYTVKVNLTLIQKNGTKTMATKSKIVEIPLNAIPLKSCTIPVGYAAFGIQSLSFNDRVSCSEKEESAKQCVVGSLESAVLGVNGRVDVLRTKGNALLRNNSTVYSGVWAKQIDAQDGANFTLKGNNAAFSYDAAMEIPPNGNASSTFVESSNVESCEPGFYGNVVVRSGGALQISNDGVYVFKSLRFETGSTLKIKTSGVVEIYTDDFYYSGTQSGALAKNLLVGVLGNSDVFVNTDFSGSIWAPQAKLILGQYNKKTFAGSYLAKNLSFHQDSKVQYVPFSRSGACQ